MKKTTNDITTEKRPFAFKVAGISFENRQEVAAKCEVGEAVEFIPEPKNPYDHNAIAIYVNHQKEKKDMLGYVPRKITKYLKKASKGIIRNIAGAELGTIGIVVEIPRKNKIGM